METTPSLVQSREQLREALSAGNLPLLDQLLAGLRSADLAEILASLLADNSDPSACLQLLESLPLPRQASVLGHLPAPDQLRLATALPDARLLALLEEMSSDEAADLFNLLDLDYQEVLLRDMAQRERDDIKHLAAYEEGSAGAIMTSDYVSIPCGLTVADAMLQVRRTAPDAETVYQIYVVDGAGRLAGTLSLRQLIVAPASASIDQIMIHDVIRVPVETEQETVAKLVARYDLLALPVVDAEDRLVGIVTHDDAMDVLEAEATEDIHKGMSIGQFDHGVNRAPLALLYRKRIFWLVLLVFGNLFSGAGIAHFEDTIASQVALVFFLPLLIGSGGNAGAQAATLTVRGLATGDISMRDWSYLLGREMLVALALGLTMALAVSPIGFMRGDDLLALVVALSMLSIVVFGSLLGMCLPFVLDRLGWDPATASAPLVTTVIDASGVIIYFTIATAILMAP
ncbi:MAG: magnesium transporter [Haliea sp.]